MGYYIDSASRFKEVWDSIGGINGNNKVNYVELIFHGSPTSMGVNSGSDYSRITNASDIAGANDVSITSLDQKNISLLHLSSCNTGHLDVDDNMGISFLRAQQGIDKVKAFDGLATYDPYISNRDFANPFDQAGFYKYASKNILGLSRQPVGDVEYTRDGKGGIVANFYTFHGNHKEFR